jgi:hypothetical protein
LHWKDSCRSGNHADGGSECLREDLSALRWNLGAAIRPAAPCRSHKGRPQGIL